MQFSVKAQTKEMVRDLDRLARKEVPSATASALNRSRIKIRSGAAKQLKGMYGGSVRKISRQIIAPKRIRARKDSQTTILGFRFLIPARGRPVVDGVTFGRGRRIVEVGASAEYGRPFPAAMRSGHRSVFVRAQPGDAYTDGRKRSSSPNLPIREVFLDKTLDALKAVEAGAQALDWQGLLTTELNKRLAKRRR